MVFGLVPALGPGRVLVSALCPVSVSASVSAAVSARAGRGACVFVESHAAVRLAGTLHHGPEIVDSQDIGKQGKTSGLLVVARVVVIFDLRRS